MMRDVHLHGHLHERFGGPYRFDLDTPIEAVRAFRSQLPGFIDALREGSYRVVIGDPDDGFDVGIDELSFRMGRQPALHIIPVPEGHKRGGLGKVILGVAMIGAAFVFAPAAAGASAVGSVGAATNAAASGLGATAFQIGGLSISYGQIALMGASMALQGFSQLLAPTPTVRSLERPEERQSFLFSSPDNVGSEGGIVPIAYGKRVFVGSVTISAGITTEEYSA